MARTLQKLFFGFLSTAGFIAAFVLAGDVLMAAIVAVTIAVMQFVFGKTTQAKPGVLMWVSLALVIGLTTLSFAGTDTFAAGDLPSRLSASTPDCTCTRPSTLSVQDTAIPILRDVPKALATEDSRV